MLDKNLDSQSYILKIKKGKYLLFKHRINLLFGKR